MQSVHNAVAVACITTLLGVSALIFAGMCAVGFLVIQGPNEPNPRMWIMLGLSIVLSAVLWVISLSLTVRNYRRGRPIVAIIAAALPIIGYIVIQLVLSLF